MTEEVQPGGEAPRTASEILSSAEQLAEQIRGRAHADAEAIRARAGSDSDAARAATAERVQRLSALTDGMLERLREMRAELDALGASLAGVGAEPAEPAGPAEAGLEAEADVRAAADVRDVPEAASAAPEPPEAGVDDAGARLIALNLALSDTPRDEAARQLRDQIPDAERLVDEVYASVDR